MSNGETTNLGPHLESNSGPRFSIVDMGTMVGPERMDTMAVLKSELRSVYEDNSVVIRFNRAMADPGDAVIGLLKPLIILVALVVGFIGAALILETQTGSTPAAEAASVPVAPVPEPIIAAAAIDEPAEEELANLDEPIDFDEPVDEVEAAPAEPEAVEPAPEPERRDVRKARKRHKKNKKNRKRNKKRKKRRR